MANLLVLVSYKVFPAQMGGQKAVAGLYQRLSKHHDIHLAVSKDNGSANGYSVERILYSHKRMLWNVFKIFQLKKICRRHRVQLLIAEHSYTGWLAYLLKKITGIPFVIRSHNIEASRFQQMKRPYWKLYSAYEKWIHRKAAHSFFISEEDETTGLKQFGLAPAKCDIIPYSIERPKTIADARQKLAEKFGIHSSEVFYFNGTLDYLPNRIAVENLIEKLDPILQLKRLDYTIVISGKNLPVELVNSVSRSASIVYVGFVEDVELLYQSASIFLNPVINNSGVKTKVIEALANDCKVVSMKDGAAGIKPEFFGTQMVLAENGNWEDFAEKMVAALKVPHCKTPEAFFDYFSAGNIARKAAGKIKFILHAHT
jgi:polysaccharide biosynthesis protein PslH